MAATVVLACGKKMCVLPRRHRPCLAEQGCESAHALQRVGGGEISCRHACERGCPRAHLLGNTLPAFFAPKHGRATVCGRRVSHSGRSVPPCLQVVSARKQGVFKRARARFVHGGDLKGARGCPARVGAVCERWRCRCEEGWGFLGGAQSDGVRGALVCRGAVFGARRRANKCRRRAVFVLT